MLVGIDIIEIERVKEALTRTPRLLQRLFTEQERLYCFSKKIPILLWPCVLRRGSTTQAASGFYCRSSLQ